MRVYHKYDYFKLTDCLSAIGSFPAGAIQILESKLTDELDRVNVLHNHEHQELN